MEGDADDEAGYLPPALDVAFGDIFKAPFLLDVFVREDTTLMGGGTLPSHLAPRLGKWLGAAMQQGPAVVLSDGLPPKEQDRFALAHAAFGPQGHPRLAILVSDSCLTATALAQGRKDRSPSGRLLFAPINLVDEAKWHELRDNPDFERMPLPLDDSFERCPVAELRHVFMVDAAILKRHTDMRVLSSNEHLASVLEQYWNGYAARRGPLAYERNLLKLAWLLSGAPAGATAVAPEKEAITDAIADVLDLAWALEGEELEAVSDAEEAVRFRGAEAHAQTETVRQALVERLQDIATAAERAAAALDSSA